MNDPLLALRLRRLLTLITLLAAWIPGIIVLVHMARRRTYPLVLLGLVCMVYTYIWGWIRASEENLEIVMIVWTVLLLVLLAALKYLPVWIPA
jgi:hypothetical protein